MPAKNIVWLASFPKSGNTWLRIFLANYLFNRETPMPINEVRKLAISDGSAAFYRAVAKERFDPADPAEAVRLRRKVLTTITGNRAHVNFLKTHNARVKAFGLELIPDDVTRSAIYVVRNPLDVTLSYARHFGMTLEAAVNWMGRLNNTTAANEGQVKQFLSSWSAHVEGWTRNTPFPVLALRYEDMLDDPHTAFSRALEHIGIPVDGARLDRAIRFSSFDELRRQEAEDSFVERSTKSDRFFHTGKSGQWRDALPEVLARKIGRDHGRVMRAFEYPVP